MIIYNWLHAAAVEIAEAGGVDPEFVEEVITKRCPFKIDTAYVEATGYAELITLRAQAKDLQSLYDALHLRLGQDNPYATIEKLRLDQRSLSNSRRRCMNGLMAGKRCCPSVPRRRSRDGPIS